MKVHSKLLKQTDKCFNIKKGNITDTVLIDRTKPAFIDGTLHNTAPTTPDRDGTINILTQQTEGLPSLNTLKHTSIIEREVEQFSMGRILSHAVVWQPEVKLAPMTDNGFVMYFYVPIFMNSNKTFNVFKIMYIQYIKS